jgi:hypothetical protein
MIITAVGGQSVPSLRHSENEDTANLLPQGQRSDVPEVRSGPQALFDGGRPSCSQAAEEGNGPVCDVSQAIAV